MACVAAPLTQKRLPLHCGALRIRTPLRPRQRVSWEPMASGRQITLTTRFGPYSRPQAKLLHTRGALLQ